MQIASHQEIKTINFSVTRGDSFPPLNESQTSRCGVVIASWSYRSKMKPDQECMCSKGWARGYARSKLSPVRLGGSRVCLDVLILVDGVH